MSPNERSEYSMTNTSPRRENVESPRMYTLFGDVLSRSLLAQNPEPERGAREKREFAFFDDECMFPSLHGDSTGTRREVVRTRTTYCRRSHINPVVISCSMDCGD